MMDDGVRRTGLRSGSRDSRRRAGEGAGERRGPAIMEGRDKLGAADIHAGGGRKRRMDHSRIDIDRLVRRGERLSGSWPLSAFERLGSLLANADGEVRWQASARRERRVEGGDDTYLGLAIQATLQVPCVRCLGPVAVDVDDRREFLLVADEETAERLDDPESELEVVAADTPFRLAELVEDELILAVPPLPRHEACELPAGHAGENGADAAPDDRQRPFVGLGRLRGGADETE